MYTPLNLTMQENLLLHSGDTGAELEYVQAGHEIFGDIDEVLTIGLPE